MISCILIDVIWWISVLNVVSVNWGKLSLWTEGKCHWQWFQSRTFLLTLQYFSDITIFLREQDLSHHYISWSNKLSLLLNWRKIEIHFFFLLVNWLNFRCEDDLEDKAVVQYVRLWLFINLLNCRNWKWLAFATSIEPGHPAHPHSYTIGWPTSKFSFWNF